MSDEERDRILARGKFTTWVETVQDSLRSSLAIYDVEGYGSMSGDIHRNRAFQRAFADFSEMRRQQHNAKKHRPGYDVLEIGPGADAFLTKMLLRTNPDLRILAVEGNARAAERAIISLRDAGFFAGSVDVINDLASDAPAWDFALIVHEILGYFASREGVCHVMRDLRARLPPSKTRKFIPSCFGTFYSPVHITGSRGLGAVSLAADQPRMAFAKNVCLSRRICPLSPATGVLEWFDMDRTSDQDWIHQHRTTVFKVSAGARRAEVNALCVFIYIGFESLSEARGSAKRKSRRAQSFHLAPGLAPGLNFVSATTSARIRQDHQIELLHTMFTNAEPASNWAEVLLFFNSPVLLLGTDQLHVRSVADLEPEIPDYHFTLLVKRSGSPVAELIDRIEIVGQKR